MLHVVSRQVSVLFLWLLLCAPPGNAFARVDTVSPVKKVPTVPAQRTRRPGSLTRHRASQPVRLARKQNATALHRLRPPYAAATEQALPQDRFSLAVFGGASAEMSRTAQEAARVIGTTIAALKLVVVTGACPGIPDVAVAEARKGGAPAVGYSPWITPEQHENARAPTNLSTIVLTPEYTSGLPAYYERSLSMIKALQGRGAAIAVGGRLGTNAELNIAADLRVPVGIVAGSGGVSDVAVPTLVASIRAGKTPDVPILLTRAPGGIGTWIAYWRAADQLARASRLAPGLRPLIVMDPELPRAIEQFVTRVKEFYAHDDGRLVLGDG